MAVNGPVVEPVVDGGEHVVFWPATVSVQEAFQRRVDASFERVRLADKGSAVVIFVRSKASLYNALCCLIGVLEVVIRRILRWIWTQASLNVCGRPAGFDRG